MNAPLEMSRAEWFALKRAARDLDVTKGGYWRLYRGGRIAFFCGPERPAPGVPPPKRNTDQRVLNEQFVTVTCLQLPNRAHASSWHSTVQLLM